MAYTSIILSATFYENNDMLYNKRTFVSKLNKSGFDHNQLHFFSWKKDLKTS